MAVRTALAWYGLSGDSETLVFPLITSLVEANNEKNSRSVLGSNGSAGKLVLSLRNSITE